MSHQLLTLKSHDVILAKDRRNRRGINWPQNSKLSWSHFNVPISSTPPPQSGKTLTASLLAAHTNSPANNTTAKFSLSIQVRTPCLPRHYKQSKPLFFLLYSSLTQYSLMLVSLNLAEQVLVSQSLPHLIFVPLLQQPHWSLFFSVVCHIFPYSLHRRTNPPPCT